MSSLTPCLGEVVVIIIIWVLVTLVTQPDPQTKSDQNPTQHSFALYFGVTRAPMFVVYWAQFLVEIAQALAFVCVAVSKKDIRKSLSPKQRAVLCFRFQLFCNVNCTHQLNTSNASNSAIATEIVNYLRSLFIKLILLCTNVIHFVRLVSSISRRRFHFRP